MQGAAPMIYITILVIVFLFLKNAGKKANGGKKSAGKAPAQKAQMAAPKSKASDVPARSPFSLHKDEEDCEFGEENHTYSHDAQQRIEQLDSFLKNGIIDREEYKVLLKRYREYKD